LLEKKLRVVENATRLLARCGCLFYVLVSLSLCKCCKLIVEVVSIKHLLSRVTSQIRLVLFEFGVINVFPLFLYVLLIKVIFLRRDEW